MKRDGQCISLWQHGMPPYESKTQELPDELADVIIVGGGITGISVALALQKAGKKCMVLEAQGIGFGTTGGTTAHLNTIMDTPYYQIKKNFGSDSGQMVANLTRNAIELIERNVQEYSIDCDLKRLPAYLFSQNEEQDGELEKIVDSSKEVGIAIDFNASLPIPVPFKKVAVVEQQGQFHATKYLYGIATAFENAGGRIIQNCRVTDVTKNDDALDVSCTKGKMRARFVIYATHIPPGVNILHFRCVPYRSYAMAVKLKNDTYPDGLVYDLFDPYHYYRSHKVGNTQYLIAGGEDHKTGHEENTGQCFLKLESHIRKYFEVDSIPFKWSSQYFEPADGLPYIGQLPGNAENVLVATGFGGNGIIYGTASALILADLICNGKSEYKGLFNPGRVKPVAGFENFMKAAADVTGVFIGKRFEIEKIDGIVELARGEARVVKYEGHNIAMYKDESGKLFAVNPSCPHISCVVGWNEVEKSWDCPCHGSRFSFTGELLTAPARKDLDVIDLDRENESK